MEKLRGLISDGGMSRSGLARAAGLHANSLRRMDEPDWNPTADTLGKLETYLLKREGGTALASPEEINNEARNGRMFILVDDEDRVNEGAPVITAQRATRSEECLVGKGVASTCRYRWYQYHSQNN